MKRAIASLAVAIVLIALYAHIFARPDDCDAALQAQADAMDPAAIDADEELIRCFEKEGRAQAPETSR